MRALSFTDDLNPAIETRDQSHANLVIIRDITGWHVWLHREQNAVWV